MTAGRKDDPIEASRNIIASQGLIVQRDYRPDIDGLRAIAVLSVVLFHFGWPAFGGGFVGVDIFFVISGFLITRLIVDEHAATGTFRFGAFYIRRIRRLIPALACTLLVSSVAAVLIFSPAHLKRFVRELMTATLSVSNVFFYSVQGYFDIGKEFQALLHSWSLSVEEQFYLIWPVLLVFLLLRNGRALVIGLLGIGLASLVLAEIWPDRSAAFFLTPFRAFEFAIGAALVWCVRSQPRDSRALEFLFLLGVAMMAWAVHMFSSETHLPGLLMLVPTVGAALAIYAGRSRAAILLIGNPLSVWIGRISYSLYLVHWPLLIFYGYVIARPFSTADRFGLLAASILLAATMFRLVEQPFRHGRLSAGGGRLLLRRAAATGGVILLFGGAVILGEGWNWRLPPETARLLESAHREVEIREECQYRSPEITVDLQEKFERCVAERGKAVLVFGDSHAEDLFNALAVNGERPHVVAVQDAGCRPSKSHDECYYSDLPDFVARNKDDLDYLLFTQKGSYLLADHQHLPVDQQGIDNIVAYLTRISGEGVPTLWLGPQWEPYYEIDQSLALPFRHPEPDYLSDAITHIADVDSAIAATVDGGDLPFEYVSKIDILGPLTSDRFIMDGEYTYSDTDHWSAKGEEVFGAKLLEKDERLRKIFRVRDREDTSTSG